MYIIYTAGVCIFFRKLFWPSVRKEFSSDQKNLDWSLEFAKILRLIQQFVQTVKGLKIFLKKNTFLTCYWRFWSRSNTNITIKMPIETNNCDV